jgi:hypothetical protein
MFTCEKPGGQFIQTMNTEKSFIEFYEVMESVLDEYGLKLEIEWMHKHIYEKKSPVGEISGLLEKHHFL